MYWLFGAFLLGLIYVSFNHAKVSCLDSLRAVWGCFVGIAATEALFALIKAFAVSDPKVLAAAQLWGQVIEWILFAICLYMFCDALIPGARAESSSERADENTD